MSDWDVVTADLVPYKAWLHIREPVGPFNKEPLVKVYNEKTEKYELVSMKEAERRRLLKDQS